jgi:hypothetical protein
VEPLVRAVQDLLAPHARSDRFIDIVRQPVHPDALLEPGAGVVGRLQQTRNDGRFERTEHSGSGVTGGDGVLLGTQATTEQALPLGVLLLERVQRREQSLGGIRPACCLGPAPDVGVSGLLPAVLQLRHLRRRPGQRFR